MSWLDLVGLAELGVGWRVLLSALLIFVLRVTDMSIDTVRVVSMVKGLRLRAGALGVVEAGIFIYAISQVLQPPVHWAQMVGYACGFGVGTFAGSALAGWLMSGYVLLRVLSREHPRDIASRLRRDGFAVTIVGGEGREGPLLILFSVVPRRAAGQALLDIREIDADAFMTIEPIERAVGGYIPRLSPWRPSVRR